MGIAVDGNLLEVAGFVALKGELQIVGQVKIQQPVPVVVGESGAGPPAGIGDPRSPAHVLEGAVAQVSVEHIGTHVGDVDVHVAIVVVVSEGAPHAVGRIPDSGLVGDVEKGPVPPVSKQPVRALAVDEIDVHPAVAIVVQNTAAGTHGLDQILGLWVGFGDLVAVYEFEPRRSADIGEARGCFVSRRELDVEDQKEDR